MNSSEDNKDKRMKDLVGKMSQKDIVIKEDVDKEVDNAALKEQSERFKKLSLYTENLNFSNSSPMVGGVGETVNSIVDTSDGTSYNTYGFTDSTAKPAVNSGVTAKEALELSIKRTIESGAPINNIGFYDEINWNLEKMGYPAKLPLDIKEALNDMLKYGEIKNS